MRDPHLVLVKPMVSEKSIILMEDNKYSFLVAKDANKIEIKHAVETLFNVKVLDVTTRNLKMNIKTLVRVMGLRPYNKRAIGKLAEDDKIEICSNLQ